MRSLYIKTHEEAAEYVSGAAVLPDDLTELWCSGVKLGQLPVLPASLLFLRCEGCGLTSVPELPPNLMFLDCGHNLLDSLPELPETLAVLVCRENRLSRLPELPASLTRLDCNSNHVSSLPALPRGLETLYCNNNRLETLALNEGLRCLDCGSNGIEALTLNDGLVALDCDINPIRTMPTLPRSLKHMTCCGIHSDSWWPFLERDMFHERARKIVPGVTYEALRWLEGGRFSDDVAAVVFCELVRCVPDDWDGWDRLATVATSRHDFTSGLDAVAMGRLLCRLPAADALFAL